jgi:myo-inositol 2-dehydrogenase/D-chiro-inositol 1-dehydrogenase
MPPVRFALAGFGAWGKFHAQSIAGNPDAQLVAITVPSEASREEARKLYPEAQIFADSLEMIAQAEFDIIDIATPSHTHREIALAAMAKGQTCAFGKADGHHAGGLQSHRRGCAAIRRASCRRT